MGRNQLSACAVPGMLQRGLVFNSNCFMIFNVKMLSAVYGPRKQNADGQNRQKEGLRGRRQAWKWRRAREPTAEGAASENNRPGVPGSCAATREDHGAGRAGGWGRGSAFFRPTPSPPRSTEAYRALRSSDATCDINRGLRPVTRTGDTGSPHAYRASVKPPRLDAGCGRRGASARAELPCPSGPQDLDT